MHIFHVYVNVISETVALTYSFFFPIWPFLSHDNFLTLFLKGPHRNVDILIESTNTHKSFGLVTRGRLQQQKLWCPFLLQSMDMSCHQVHCMRRRTKSMVCFDRWFDDLKYSIAMENMNMRKPWIPWFLGMEYSRVKSYFLNTYIHHFNCLKYRNPHHNCNNSTTEELYFRNHQFPTLCCSFMSHIWLCGFFLLLTY